MKKRTTHAVHAPTSARLLVDSLPGHPYGAEEGSGAPVLDLRDGAAAGTRRVLIGGCLVDLGERDILLRMLRGHVNRPAATGTVLVASANLDHVTHFGNRAAGDELDPGRMDDWLVLLDGHPLLVAAQRLTGVRYPRMAGADLLPVLLGFAEADARPVAFLGGHPSVRGPLAAVIQEQWPNLRTVGHWTPERAVLLDPSDSHRLATEIAGSGAALLVVALGKPLQERWLAEHGRVTGVQLAVAFGAAIDFVAGTASRAPGWVQSAGLEWSYRLLREPGRMWRRYLLQGPPAVIRVRRTRVAGPSVPELALPLRLFASEVEEGGVG